MDLGGLQGVFFRVIKEAGGKLDLIHLSDDKVFVAQDGAAYLEAGNGLLHQDGIVMGEGQGDGVVKGNRFVEAYSRFSTMLDRALTEERARALGLDEQEYRNDGEKTAFIQQAVRRAVSECNPLEAEELLLRLRFDFLDRNVGSGHRWDLTFLVCYALKLSLLSRRSAFTRERGSEEFERLTSQLRKEIFS